MLDVGSQPHPTPNKVKECNRTTAKYKNKKSNCHAKNCDPESDDTSVRKRNRRPDKQLYVPRAKRYDVSGSPKNTEMQDSSPNSVHHITEVCVTEPLQNSPIQTCANNRRPRRAPSKNSTRSKSASIIGSSGTSANVEARSCATVESPISEPEYLGISPHIGGNALELDCSHSSNKHQPICLSPDAPDDCLSVIGTIPYSPGDGATLLGSSIDSHVTQLTARIIDQTKDTTLSSHIVNAALTTDRHVLENNKQQPFVVPEIAADSVTECVRDSWEDYADVDFVADVPPGEIEEKLLDATGEPSTNGFCGDIVEGESPLKETTLMEVGVGSDMPPIKLDIDGENPDVNIEDWSSRDERLLTSLQELCPVDKSIQPNVCSSNSLSESKGTECACADVDADMQPTADQGCGEPCSDTDSVLMTSLPAQHEHSVTLPDKTQEAILTVSAIAAASDNAVHPDDDDDDDDWDAIYDENGDCLDQDLEMQLTKTFGQVSVHVPHIDYLAFKPKKVDLKDEEYGHVIEMYDFPVEFKTQDLLAAFIRFQDKGFDIKWVDDTHALGVFASRMAAEDALAICHPFIKTRPLSQATAESRQKARRRSEFMQPYKPRPQTSAAMARRMVSSALGLALPVSRETREVERKKLLEAKELKKRAAKQKEAAWEGVIGSAK